MTTKGYVKTPNSVIPTKLLVGILMLLLTISTKNEEQILALERRTGFLFGERRTIQRSTSFFCSYGPPTTNLRPRPILQLQLGTCSWSYALPTSDHWPL